MNGKRNLLRAMLGVAVLLMSFCFANADTGGVSITLDGESLTFTESTGAPYIDGNNRTQVPLRVTMEACDCQVDWDQASKTATVKKNETTVSIPVGARYIYVNGEQKAMDTAAVIQKSRTYLPIRAVLEAFGYSLGYDNSKKTVKILSLDGTKGSIPAVVHFIDVGQGDCELIDFGDCEILIDGGKLEYAEKVSSYVKPYIDGKLDYYIATHPDYDHIGAGVAILQDYEIGTVIHSGFLKDTAIAKAYQSVLDAMKCTVLEDEDKTFDLGNGASLQIIETGDNYEESNNNSVVAMFCYGDVKVLLTGDMQSEAELAALDKFCDVDVLKVAHHASKTSSSDEFLAKVKPEYAVISCGETNDYYHPHKRAMRRIANAGATMLGTFKSGTLVMTANQADYYWNIVQPLTLDDAGIYHMEVQADESAEKDGQD